MASRGHLVPVLMWLSLWLSVPGSSLCVAISSSHRDARLVGLGPTPKTLCGLGSPLGGGIGAHNTAENAEVLFHFIIYFMRITAAFIKYNIISINHLGRTIFSERF